MHRQKMAGCSIEQLEKEVPPYLLDGEAEVIPVHLKKIKSKEVEIWQKRSFQ